MGSVVDRILEAAGWGLYLLVALIVFAEDALFVGFVLPGETAAVIGGVAAHEHHATLWLMMVVVVVAAIVGDTVGYEVGRHLGTRVLDSRFLAKRRRGIDRAQDFLRRRGGWAVLLGRFVAFFRAVMPALAGTARMPYHVFLAFNAVGGIVWGVGFVLLGYLAGASYQRIEATVGHTAAYVVAGVVVLGLLVWFVRRRRQEHREETGGATPAGNTSGETTGGHG